MISSLGIGRKLPHCLQQTLGIPIGHTAREIILTDGLSFKLDSRGNAKATELVGKTGKKSAYEVAVTGGMSKHTIQVESMPLAK
jgi:hypothetical protein